MPEAVIKQEEGGLSSDVFVVYVRANMENPVLVSEVLREGAGGNQRQPRQETNRGLKR